MPATMLWRVSRPIRTRTEPPGFILPCQPALAYRPPSGPGWLHEIKFDGYRVIARKDGEHVRLWARTTSDYSNAFCCIRKAVTALPVDNVVLDGEAVVLRADHRFDFEALRSRHGQAEAIMVAYDIMEVDGKDVRPEPLEERRKRLNKLLSRSNKAMRDGIQLSEAITGDGGAIFKHACRLGLEGIVSKRIGSRYVSGRTRAWLKTKNPDFERR
jgi:bifunctional non-homologous end joining protein LigD